MAEISRAPSASGSRKVALHTPACQKDTTMMSSAGCDETAIRREGVLVSENQARSTESNPSSATCTMVAPRRGGG